VGAGAPDIFNVLNFVDTVESHQWSGIAIAVPFTVIYSIVLRRYCVDGLFGSMPDFGPLKARSYRVLKRGRPRLLITLWSALIGVFSHVIVDSFTHTWRLGSRSVGFQRVLFDGPEGAISIAKTLQYLGHTVGSLIGMVLLVLVVSDKHLGEWYGIDQIEASRTAPVREHSQRRAIMILIASIMVGAVWGVSIGWFPIFHIGFVSVFGFLLIGIVNRPTATTLATCLDTSIPLTTMSSTPSVERSPKTSRRSAISRHRSFLTVRPHRRPSSFDQGASSPGRRVSSRRSVR